MDIINIIGLLSTSGMSFNRSRTKKYVHLNLSQLYIKVAKNLNLLAVTSSVEAGYDEVDIIRTDARKRLDRTEDKRERRQLKTLIMSTSSLRPLSANGYFDISRETLTSMMSVR